MRPAQATLLLTATLATTLAQSPAFEAAVIKPNDSNLDGSDFRGLINGTLQARNVPFKMMVEIAYNLSPLRVSGPDWLSSTKFDITAKSPQGVPGTEMKPMLQTLLKERFHLEFHREMKKMPVYEMVVAKGGLKIHPFDPANRLEPSAHHSGVSTAGFGTMADLASMLSGPVARPVVDHTGLNGKYEYVLTYMPLDAPGSNPAPDAPPDFFTAVRQQLGLKLKPTKGSIEILVVDHADRTPTAN